LKKRYIRNDDYLSEWWPADYGHLWPVYSYGFGTVQETYRIVDGRGGAGFERNVLIP
jgi:catalase (peroxidase I)